MNGTNGTLHDVASIIDTSKLQAIILSLLKDSTSQGERIQELDAGLQKITSQISTSGTGSQRDHEAQLARQEDRITSLERQLADRLASVERKANLAAHMETRLTEIEREVEERLASVERKVRAATEMERDIEDRFAPLESKVGHSIAMESDIKDRLESLEGKVHLVDTSVNAQHNDLKDQIQELRQSQTWRAKEVAKEAADAEAKAAEARRLAIEAEELAALQRQRRLKEREEQLAREVEADEAAAAERFRKRKEREAELERERLADEAAAADRSRKRREFEAELEKERLEAEAADAERQQSFAAMAEYDEKKDEEYARKLAQEEEEDDDPWEEVAPQRAVAQPKPKVSKPTKPAIASSTPAASVPAAQPKPAPSSATSAPPVLAPASESVAVAGDDEAKKRASTGGDVGSGGRLRLLESSQKNQYKLCKKKLKEIDALGAQIDKKTLKFRDLSDEQKEKLGRRKELNDTISELERLADELVQKEEVRLAEEARLALMQTPEYKAAEAARKAAEEKEAARLAEEEARRIQEEEAAAALSAEQAAAKKAAEEAAAAEAARQAAVEEAERERLAAIAAAEAAEAELQSQIRLRKQCNKKLKEIQVQEEKMAKKGQTFKDVLPEVQEKLSKKAELEAQVAELNAKLGDMEGAA